MYWQSWNICKSLNYWNPNIWIFFWYKMSATHSLDNRNTKPLFHMQSQQSPEHTCHNNYWFWLMFLNQQNCVSYWCQTLAPWSFVVKHWVYRVVLWQSVVVLACIMEWILDKEADLKMMESFGSAFNWLCGHLGHIVFFFTACVKITHGCIKLSFIWFS